MSDNTVVFQMKKNKNKCSKPNFSDLFFYDYQYFHYFDKKLKAVGE